LKNSLEEVIRERKVPLPSDTEAQSGLKRCIEKAANRLRKATKNKKRGSSREEERHRCTRDEVKTRGMLKTGSSFKRAFT